MLWVLAKDQRLRPLTDSENQAIRDWWGGSAGAANPAAARIIRLVREEGSWLACSCRGAVLSEMPILAPVLTGTTYSLRRLATRALHTEECCYFAEAKQIEDQDDVFDNLTPEQVPSFDLPLRLATPSEPQDKGEHRSSSVASMMARRLWWLAHHSGWQRMPRETSRSDIGSAIAVAKTVTKGQPISFFASPRAWGEGWISNALEPKVGKSEVVWWLVQVIHIDRDKRTIEVVNSSDGRSLQIQVRGDIEVLAGNATPEAYPLAALAAVFMDDAVLYIDRLIAQPMASDTNWMLLGASAQRQTLAKIVEVCDWLSSEKGVEVSVTKPLFAWHSNVKPDFLLCAPNNRYLAVETSESDDSAAKARRAVLFEKAEVIVDHADTSNETEVEIIRWALRRS